MESGEVENRTVNGTENGMEVRIKIGNEHGKKM
jgi:hypothetical protein